MSHSPLLKPSSDLPESDPKQSLISTFHDTLKPTLTPEKTNITAMDTLQQASTIDKTFQTSFLSADVIAISSRDNQHSVRVKAFNDLAEIDQQVKRKSQQVKLEKSFQIGDNYQRRKRIKLNVSQESRPNDVIDLKLIREKIDSNKTELK